MYLQPYYSNSPYKYRNFYSNFNELLNNKTTLKQVSYKSYHKGLCYIPNLPQGDIIENEIMPIKCSLYNIIDKPFYIKEIWTFDPELEISINKKLIFNMSPIYIQNKTTCSINFFPYDINDVTDNNYFKIIRWLPINNQIINCKHYYEIDISNFIEVNSIKNNIYLPTHKIIISCTYI